MLYSHGNNHRDSNESTNLPFQSFLSESLITVTSGQLRFTRNHEITAPSIDSLKRKLLICN